MTGGDVLSQRIAELEAELAQLRAERQAASPDGAMLKALLDDIALRRSVEDQLRQAQEWLTLAQEAGAVSAYTFDFATEKLDWSPSTMALYGFPLDSEATVERWLAAIHPDDLSSVQAVAEAALRDLADVNQRFRIVRDDGRTLWIQDRGRIVRNADGSPARLVGINIDVTELVELERRASEDGARLRLALAAGQNACWDWDLATNQVTWDSQLNELTGIAEFGGSFESFWKLVHDEDKPRVQAALHHAIATGEDYAVEFRMVRPDGSIRWTYTRAKVVQGADGKPLRLVGIDSDITERKLEQAELLESRLFLESVLGASPDCIKVIETDGSVSYMNVNGRKAMEIGDFSMVAGRAWTDLWPDETAGLVETALGEALQGKRTRFEGPCPTAAGTHKYWEVSVAPILGDGGTVERIVSISRDITDRRNAEQQLQLLNAELHHRIMNNIATVQALARATLRSSGDPKAFEKAFSGRLEALGKTYGLLRAGPSAATLDEMVRAELAPFGGASDQIAITGPEVPLSSSAAVSIGMILHELATNASKYGALAHADGHLAVEWRVEDGDVTLVWSERHSSPPPAARSGGGFGSTLIDRLVRQLKGHVSRCWEEDGLRVEIFLPTLGER